MAKSASPLAVLNTILVISVGASVVGDERVSSDPPMRWWKGNIHTHTFWSDGNDFPEMVAEWYRTHGYNFLALSDHNILSEGLRWMKHSEVIARGGETVLPKYLRAIWAALGRDARRARQRDYAIRLKPLNEFRALVEERGQFIMMTGEEISDSVAGKPVHMNATNLRDLLQPLGGESVAAAIRANLRTAEDHAAPSWTRDHCSRKSSQLSLRHHGRRLERSARRTLLRSLQRSSRRPSFG